VVLYDVKSGERVEIGESSTRPRGRPEPGWISRWRPGKLVKIYDT
jgi:hypothetical protein